VLDELCKGTCAGSVSPPRAPATPQPKVPPSSPDSSLGLFDMPASPVTSAAPTTLTPMSSAMLQPTMEAGQSEALGMEVAKPGNDAELAEPNSATAAEPTHDPELASSAAPEDTVAAAASKSRNKKIPHKPDKFFKRVVAPKLEAGNPPDITSYLAEWAPPRLRAIKSTMRDPTYEIIRAEARTIGTSYDDLTIQCLAERRQGEGVRIMMKVKAPGKLCQAGSLVFPVQENGCCSKIVYLHLDTLRIMMDVCERVKANLALMKAWHLEVRTYMEFFFEEL